MFQRLAKFLEVREATEDEVEDAFPAHQTEAAMAQDAVEDALNKRAIATQPSPEYERNVLDLGAEFLAHHADAHVEIQPSVSFEADQVLVDEFIQQPSPLKVTAGVHTTEEAHQRYAMVPSNRTHEDEKFLTDVPLESSPQLQATKHSDITMPEVVFTPRTYEASSKLSPHGHTDRHVTFPSDYPSTSSVIRPRLRLLDSRLARIFSDPTAHLTDEYDAELFEWALNGDISLDQIEDTQLATKMFDPVRSQVQTANSSDPQEITELQSRIRLLESRLAGYEHIQEELQMKTERLFFLETELVAAERSRIEAEDRLRQEQLRHQEMVKTLENEVARLSNQNTLGETRSLLVEMISSRGVISTPNGSSQQATDDLMKHCGRLVRRLALDKEELTPQAANGIPEAKIAGRQLASMAAKVIASEQRVKDEKLVLKNLFLSWMERGERKDAFEILARAFDFTPEDRKRMEAKNALARGASLGVNWSLTEGIADFIRDETS